MSLQHAHTRRVKAVWLARGACAVKRADLFKQLALGTAGMVAARALPPTPEEVAEKISANGRTFNGPLHVHGNGHIITNCTFRVDGTGPGLLINPKEGQSNV